MTRSARVKLYQRRAEIDRQLKRLPYDWAPDLARRVAAILEADAQSAARGADNARAYSDELREKIISAIPRRLLHKPGCAQRTLDRIDTAGSTSYGLRRMPDIETVAAAVREAERRNPREAGAAFSSTLGSSLLSCVPST